MPSTALFTTTFPVPTLCKLTLSQHTLCEKSWCLLVNVCTKLLNRSDINNIINIFHCISALCVGDRPDQKFTIRDKHIECSDLFRHRLLRMVQRREGLCCNPYHCSLSLAQSTSLPKQLQYSSLLLAFCFAWSKKYSHDDAAFRLVLAEGGGKELCLAGQMEESLREAADRTGFIGRLEFIHAGQSRATENTVDALFWGEGWAL